MRDTQEVLEMQICECGEKNVAQAIEIFQNTSLPFKKAKKLELKMMTYFEWVWEISKNYKTIAVAWAHWKSTTTSMIAILMQELWLSPSCIVWTKVPNFWNKNFLVWDWEFLIVEACEYRENFLNLEVFWEVILNIEAEHLDYYWTEKKYLEAFEKFEKKIPDDWFLVWNKNCKNSKKIFSEIEKKISNEELEQICDIITAIKAETSIRICASLGLLNENQFIKLKNAGVTRIHNNLETSRNYFQNICTTHTYDDKIKAINAAKNAGLNVCSGGIFGLGESMEDRIDMAVDIRELDILSIPINVLIPIKGTPLENNKILSKKTKPWRWNFKIKKVKSIKQRKKN